MSIGFGDIVSYGAGSKSTITAATTIAHSTIGSGVASGDLTIAVIYVVYSAAPANPGMFGDGGNPWMVLAWGYDATTRAGIYVLGMVHQVGGSVSTTFTISDVNCAATCQSYTFLPPGGFSGSHAQSLNAQFRWELPRTRDAQNAYFLATSSTTLTCVGISHPYSQGLEVACGGYNNGGNTTTIGVVSSQGGTFIERFDTGQNSPPHGVFLDSKLVYSSQFVPSGDATLTVAKTNKWGARVFIPLVANAMAGSQRWMQNRRFA